MLVDLFEFTSNPHRRDYDRSLRTAGPSHFTYGRNTRPGTVDDFDDEPLTNRSRGSTHAWDSHRRSHGPGRYQRMYPSDPGPGPNSSTRRGPGTYHYTGTASGENSTWRHHAGRTTSGPNGEASSSSSNRSKREREWELDEEERIRRSDSGLWRFGQVFGIFWVLSMLGGWSVNAS